jgi:hypothetical protein
MPGERPFEDDWEYEDGILRSMGRRKKNSEAEIHECSLCDKKFKRPRDLARHLKTHVRPWKLPDDKCKYDPTTDGNDDYDILGFPKMNNDSIVDEGATEYPLIFDLTDEEMERETPFIPYQIYEPFRQHGWMSTGPASSTLTRREMDGSTETVMPLFDEHELPVGSAEVVEHSMLDFRTMLVDPADELLADLTGDQADQVSS